MKVPKRLYTKRSINNKYEFIMKKTNYAKKTNLIKFILLSLLISIFPVITYGNDNTKNLLNNLRIELDYMFSKLNRSIVPTGLLIDNAIEYENLDKFDGNKNLQDNNICDVITYDKIIKTLKSSSLYGNPFSAFEEDINQSEKYSSSNPIVRLSVLLYDYSQIKRNALIDNLICFNNGQVNCNTKDAFQIRNVNAACIMDYIKTSNDITFCLPKSFLLNNRDINDVEIDYGNGYMSILNKQIHTYLNNGKHCIKIKTTDYEGNIYLSYSSITVNAENLPQTRSLTNMETFSISGDAFRGITTQADITIVRSQSNYSGNIKKPLVFVEGFDPRELDLEKHGSMNVYTIYRDEMFNFINSNNYDLIYIDWQNPGEYIQANANTLIKVLNNLQEQFDSDTEPIILIGHSMGGLIARYALKTMENQNIQHGVGTYVSWDSPHLGANIPIGLLYGFHGIRKFLTDKDIISSLTEKYAGINELLLLGERIAYSTSTQQMLMNYVDPTGTLNNTEHIHWQNELSQLGFPQGDNGKDFKMLAIANGDYSPINTSDKYIYCDFSAGTNVGSAVFPILPLVVGIGLQDVIAGLLCALPGRDSVNGIFECLSAKSTGQLVTNINIGYKKDFLWIVPISKTVFDYKKYHNGNYLFDTYPASMYNVIPEILYTQEGNIPIILDYGLDAQIAPTFPFIPTSSALAYGNGTNASPSVFTNQPTDMESSFGKNYYLVTNNHGHSDFSFDALIWIKSHLETSIRGASIGYTGAQYSLTNVVGNIEWSSSNSSVATINQQGVLTVKNKGVTQIIGRCNGINYSKKVIVGLPQYILSSSHEPNGFKIEATCIDDIFIEHIETVNNVFKFHWGIKFPDKPIEWRDIDKPYLFVPLESKDAVVFFKTSDGNGNETQVQSIKTSAQDVFLITNNNIKIDNKQNIYLNDDTPYSYKYGKVYLTRNTNLSSEYQDAIWTSTEAEVFGPFSTSYTLPISRGEMSIKNILPQDELNYITNNYESGKVYLYTITLLNPEDKIIQFMPFTVTTK